MLDTTHLPTALSEANAPAVIDQTHPPLSNTIPQSFRALASEAPLQAAMDSLLTNFLADEDGLHFMEEGADDAEYRWICGPLIVESKAHTNSGKDWSTCIHLLDQDGKVVSLALPNSEIMCKMSAVIMQLTLLGFLITHEKKLHAVLGRLLMQWETKERTTFVDQFGWTDNSCSSFILGDGTVIGNANVLPRAHLVGVISATPNTQGTLKDWRADISMPAASNPLMIVVISLGLSGPLLQLLGMEVECPH